MSNRGRDRFPFQPSNAAERGWRRGSGLCSTPLLLTLDLLGMTVIQCRSSEQEALSSSPVGVVSLRILRAPRHSSDTETHYTGRFIPANSLKFIKDTSERRATASVKLVTYSVTSHRWQLLYIQSCQTRGFIFISSQFMWRGSNHTEQTASGGLKSFTKCLISFYMPQHLILRLCIWLR